MIITVVDRSEGKIKDAELKKVVKALNVQVERDFVPYWGMPAEIRIGSGPAESELPDYQDAAVIYLQKEVDVAGAVGYHDRTNKGIPFGVVFTDIAEQLGEPWSVTLSHEVLETIADPQVNLLCMGPHPTEPSRDVFHWFEMCDAVQADVYAIDKVQVSNFLLPVYFTPEREEGAANDFLEKGLVSFKVRAGGYIGFFDPVTRKHETYMRRGDRKAARRLEIKLALAQTRRALRYQRFELRRRKPRR